MYHPSSRCLVLIKQHFAPHQEPNLEVEFGYTTPLTPISRSRGKLPVYFFPRSPSQPFSNVFDGSFSLKDGTKSKCSLLKGSPKILPKI